MKQITAALLAVTIATTAAVGADSSLKDNKDKLGYGIGLDMGQNFKKQGVDINPDTFIKGLKDGLAGAEPKMTEDEIKAVFTAVQQEMAKKQMEKAEKLSATNKTEGETFLAANKKKDGVVTTASGLQYKVIKAGTGPKPKLDSVVKTHYHGTLINGTVFDSSVKRGEPVEFEVGGVIKGWTEALQLMPVGSKWQLFIPSDLAYGPRGAGADIGPNATLIFEVELLSISPAAAKN
jgi:FKBP-type peptidyl-prolyl cis-trans isomerase FklB